MPYSYQDGGTLNDIADRLVRQMYDAYAEGATLEEVSKRFEVTETRARALFQAADLKIRTHAQAAAFKKKVHYPVKQMYLIYEGGATLEDVGRQFGLSATTVRRLFDSAGLGVRTLQETVALRKKLGSDPVKIQSWLSQAERGRAQEMYSLYRGGMSVKRIGKKFGISGYRVGKLMRAALLAPEPELHDCQTGEHATAPDEDDESGRVEPSGGALEWDAQLDAPIEDLKLGVRTENCLKRAGIMTIGTLVSWSEADLATLPLLGEGKLRAIIQALESVGLKLAPDEL